jgi:hypothetical protein
MKITQEGQGIFIRHFFGNSFIFDNDKGHDIVFSLILAPIRSGLSTLWVVDKS